MKTYKALVLILALVICNINCQSEEIFLNVPVNKQNKANTVSYYIVYIEEKIPDLQLTVVATGNEQYSEPEVSIRIAEWGDSFEQLIQKNPNYLCQQSRNNVCAVPENKIVVKEKLMIVVGVVCYMKCSYNLEVSYTQMREFQMNTSFGYQKGSFPQNEDIVSLSGWFKVPKNQNILQVRLTVYELFPNAKALPINILMNPGKQGVGGNTAKYQSITGVVNSALITLHQSDLKYDEFSFVILFPSASILLIRLESFDGGLVKLRVDSFTQNEQNINEKMIYQIYNPTEGNERVDTEDKSLVIKILSQQGYGLIRLAGKTIPQFDDDFLLSTQENIFEQKLVVTQDMRKKMNLGEDLFHLMIQPVSGYMVYMVEVYYQFENEAQIEELEFNIQTHHILNGKSANHYKLVISGENSFKIDFKLIHKEGSSTVLLKKCKSQTLQDCQLNKDRIQEIIGNKAYTSNEEGIIKVSQNNAIHNINFTSDQSNGSGVCIYYIVVINHDDDNYRYMMIAEHSQKTTIIKDNEIYYGDLPPNKYVYYEYDVPSIDNENSTIEYVKIVLTAPSKKPVLGANISSKTNQDRPTIEKADIFNSSDFLIIRKAEYGNLNGLRIMFFVYTEESSVYNVHVNYHVQDKISMKNLILNQSITDVLDSYESKGMYKILLWMQYHQNADLKIIIKPILGSFYFQYCKKLDKLELSECTQSANNQLIIPRKQIKENTLLSYIQVFPQILPGKESTLSHSNLQYKLGIYLSDFIQILEKNLSHTIQLKPTELIYYKIMISSGDSLRLFMFSDNETVGDSNAVGYISYDTVNTKPNASNNNQTIHENAFVQINQEQTIKICQRATEIQTECYIYVTFEATKKNTQVTFNANKQEQIVKLYSNMIHKDEYPKNTDSYHRYYYLAKRNTTTILQTLNPLAKLEIYVNFVDPVEDIKHYADDETLYPNKHKFSYKLEETGDPYINTIDLDNALMDYQASACKQKTRCLFLISIRLHDDYLQKNLVEEYYTLRVLVDEIQLQQNQRELHSIRRGYNKYFKISINPEDERYILHVNPVGICEVETVVLKLGQQHKLSFKEKGGNLIVIDKQNKLEGQQIQGDYLVTVSSEDNYCQFYIVGYVTNYQYVRIQAGNYFHSNLGINQQLFLEYSDVQPPSFRIEASVEEGSIKIGVDCEQNLLSWNPNKPILNYSENNLKDTRKHTVLWDKSKHSNCERCKYIIAIQAIKETSLSIVVKNDLTYTNIPAQRMFRVEALNNSLEQFHFYPHFQRFSIQVTLLSGSIKVYGQPGYTVFTNEQAYLFSLNGVYVSQEATFSPTQVSTTDPTESTHSKPYSFAVKADKDSVFIISFQSNFKAMHLSSGFPYFKQLSTLDSLELQYKSLSSGYSKSTEFTVYLLNDIYHHQSNVGVENAIKKYNSQNQSQNKTIGWSDFYPTITIEDSSFKRDFDRASLSNSTILFHKDNQNGTYTMKISNDGLGLLELNERISFYVIPHSGIQHLIQDQLLQKKALQGSFDNFEFYSEGAHEVVIELIQCYGQSILSVSDESTNSFGSREFKVMAEHPNLYVTKIETGSDIRDKLLGHVNYFFTVQNLQQSQYRIRANVYPPQTVYPYQLFTSGDFFQTSYNSETKMLDVSFDGLKCSVGCNNSIFTLLSVSYVFDSDYQSANNAQGNAICGYPFYFKHLKVLYHQINEQEKINNGTAVGNVINHTNITTSLDIDQILDKGASKLRVPEFYLSLVGKAIFHNSYTKKFEVFYFPFKSNTISVKWIEHQREKGHQLALILGLVFGGVVLLSVAGYFIFRWYRKSRRNIRFEMSDVLNTSISTQPSNALQVNLNHNVEMKKYSQNYSEFKDEEDQEV